MINKIRIFRKEINYIKNLQIKELVMLVLSSLPDCFFYISMFNASKNLPTYALGSGGIIRHTKAACKIAKDILDLEQYNLLGTESRDIIFAALILHDGLKRNNSMDIKHPLKMAKHIAMINQKYKVVDKNTLFSLVSAVESHMGEWNYDEKNEEILPKPNTDIQKLVHLFNYLASTQYLVVDFGINYYRPDNYKDNLEVIKNKLIDVCQNKIKLGFKVDYIYSFIAFYNNGEKNPKKIFDINIVEFLIFKISTLEFVS